MYFREFGIPARIARCSNVESLEGLIRQYNGKKNCYTSVYVFDDSKDKEGGRTNYNTAALNTIWFDFDDEKNVDKCLKDVKKFIRRFCKPLKITPRIYLTGGKGFQMNIDFVMPVDLPEHIKKDSVKNYLLHLKKEYKLSTLDDICINNSVSCMRRIVNTLHMKGGVYCTQFSVEDVMKLSIEEMYAIALEGNCEIIPPVKSPKATRRFVEFVCDQYDIKHTVSNSIDFLLNQIENAAGSVSLKTDYSNEYIKPPRKCVMELINSSIDRGHSNHEQNNIIATELVNGGYSDQDISFVFKSIYNEPAGDWGWYKDNPREAGRHITLIRQKALNRYSKDKLIQAGVCEGNDCVCNG